MTCCPTCHNVSPPWVCLLCGRCEPVMDFRMLGVGAACGACLHPGGLWELSRDFGRNHPIRCRAYYAAGWRVYLVLGGFAFEHAVTLTAKGYVPLNKRGWHYGWVRAERSSLSRALASAPEELQQRWQTTFAAYSTEKTMSLDAIRKLLQTLGNSVNDVCIVPTVTADQPTQPDTKTWRATTTGRCVVDGKFVDVDGFGDTPDVALADLGHQLVQVARAEFARQRAEMEHALSDAEAALRAADILATHVEKP